MATGEEGSRESKETAEFTAPDSFRASLGINGHSSGSDVSLRGKDAALPWFIAETNGAIKAEINGSLTGVARAIHKAF